MKQEKRKVYVERDGFWTEASLLMMGFAVVFRLLSSIGHWNEQDFLVMQLALPAASGLLFIAFTLLLGRRAFWTTSVPVLFGVVYFIYQSIGVESDLEKILYILLYVAVAVMYFGLTVSRSPFNWILAAVFGLFFAYRVGMRDVPALLVPESSVGFLEGIREMSVLALLLSLFSISLAAKRPKPTEPELPKVKDPVVVPPAPAPVVQQTAVVPQAQVVTQEPAAETPAEIDLSSAAEESVPLPEEKEPAVFDVQEMP